MDYKSSLWSIDYNPGILQTELSWPPTSQVRGLQSTRSGEVIRPGYMHTHSLVRKCILLPLGTLLYFASYYHLITNVQVIRDGLTEWLLLQYTTSPWVKVTGSLLARWRIPVITRSIDHGRWRILTDKISSFYFRHITKAQTCLQDAVWEIVDRMVFHWAIPQSHSVHSQSYPTLSHSALLTELSHYPIVL